MRIVALGDPETLLGLRLVGLDEGYDSKTVDDAVSTLRLLLDRDDVGVIIITSDYYQEMEEIIEEIREESIFPLLVEIPTRTDLEARR